jgi:hypothetical protein
VKGTFMNFWKQLKNNILKLMIKLDNGFLCDTCRFNHPSDCPHPERPNKKSCRDYEHK